MKVFLGWSGDRSKELARFLRDWLVQVLHKVEPWMSAEDIGAGKRWNAEIASELQSTQFGIICVTPSNYNEPWIVFEAGALAKSVKEGRVCPYLLGMKPTDMPQGPLTQFQGREANKEDTFKLLRDINDALGDQQRKDNMLKESFDMWWPKLSEKLDEIRGEEEPVEPKREKDDMIEDILQEVRNISRVIQSLQSHHARMQMLMDTLIVQKLKPTSASTSSTVIRSPSLDRSLSTLEAHSDFLRRYPKGLERAEEDEAAEE